MLDQNLAGIAVVVADVMVASSIALHADWNWRYNPACSQMVCSLMDGLPDCAVLEVVLEVAVGTIGMLEEAGDSSRSSLADGVVVVN